MEPSVARVGGVSYLHIPAREPRSAAGFYATVFGWSLSGDPDRPSFSDGTGHVIGRWVTDRRPAPEAGFLPYVYVEDVQAVIAAALALGGRLVTPAYPEGNLLVAVVADPDGNSIGAWQEATRREVGTDPQPPQ